jgi:hypothetical protein
MGQAATNASKIHARLLSVLDARRHSFALQPKESNSLEIPTFLDKRNPEKAA